MAVQAYELPLVAQAVDGEVVLVAPRGAAAISLTPDAAVATAHRLEAAARSARDQEPDAGGDGQEPPGGR